VPIVQAGDAHVASAVVGALLTRTAGGFTHGLFAAAGVVAAAQWAGCPDLSGLVRLGCQTRDLILDLEFLLLEAANRIVVGKRSRILFTDRMLERRMLGLQRFDVIYGAHRQPPCCMAVHRM
jgi:hypothetical protein